MNESLRPARVRVPCSTSNLGAGFDTIGLALSRYLHATYEPGPGTLRTVRTGSLSDLEHSDGDDLVAHTLRSVLERAGRADVGGELRLDSDVPVGRGLGSSAAAVLAGHELARAALGLGTDRAAGFQWAYRHEGHGDNAAPCLYGGLRAVVPFDAGVGSIELPLSDDIGWAYAAPAASIDTRVARRALPAQVSHGGAALALARITALVRGLATADPELLRVGFEDELHVPHRLPMIPGAYNAIGAGYDAGAWAVTISGAGSGLIAVSDPDVAPEVARAMREVFSTGSGDPECVGFALRPDREGLRRL